MTTIDLTGNVYGKLTVLGLHGSMRYPSGGTRRMWLCRCECGVETVVAGNNLTLNHTTTCGAKQHAVTYHGKTGTQLYHVWENMLARCGNSTHPSYIHYGGRGITVCDRWLDFRAFCEDAGDGWRDGLVFDRLDNDGNYTKENCHWVTPLRSVLNRSNTLTWESSEVKGLRLTAREWSCLSLQIPRLVLSRLRRGWSVEDAIMRPLPRARSEP